MRSHEDIAYEQGYERAAERIADLEAALRRLVAAVEVAFERPDLLAVETDLKNALAQAALKLGEAK
jgi:Holliday junction resolvasome RuvABC endonuclease subunit